MSKQAKKRPKPLMAWAVASDGVLNGNYVFKSRGEARDWGGYAGQEVIRVRIVPVVAKAKRRKGAK